MDTNQVIAVLDTETTGLSPRSGDRICEIGIVVALGDEILDTYQTLINPQRPISPGAARVNGLTDSELRDAPMFSDVADQILKHLDCKALVCHNAPFDIGFLRSEFNRLEHEQGISAFGWEPAIIIDTLEIARQSFNFPSNSLTYIASWLGIRTPNEHRALGDALTTFHVFRWLAANRDSGTQPIHKRSAGSYPHARLPSPETSLPPEILEALTFNQSIEITYIDRQGNETYRKITPRHVIEGYDTLYLVAYCHLRQAERQFRLDRVVTIKKVAEHHET